MGNLKVDIYDILNQENLKVDSFNLFLDENLKHSDSIEKPTHWNWILTGELNGVRYNIELIYPIK